MIQQKKARVFYVPPSFFSKAKKAPWGASLDAHYSTVVYKKTIFDLNYLDNVCDPPRRSVVSRADTAVGGGPPTGRRIARSQFRT